MDEPAPDLHPPAVLPGADPRRAAFVIRRNQTITAARATRRAELQQRAPAIERALEAYRKLDTGDHPEIRLRRPFVRLARRRPQPDREVPYRDRRAADIDSRPPLTKLIHRRTYALPVLLTAIYTAHLDFPPGRAVSNTRHNTFTDDGRAPWATLAGMHDTASRTARHRRLRRALEELDRFGLIAIGPPTTNRYTDWTLRAETGSSRPYTVPGEANSSVVRVPAWFFLQGWHLVLEPREVATYLMVVDMVREHSHVPFVGIAPSTRYSRYGLPDDTFSDSLDELRDFGLIDTHNPMAGRAADTGEERMTYQLRTPSQRDRHLDLAQKSALEVALEDLAYPLPQRLAGFDDRTTLKLHAP